MVRIVYAGLFELGLLVVLMPFIAWYLQVSLWGWPCRAPCSTWSMRWALTGCTISCFRCRNGPGVRYDAERRCRAIGGGWAEPRRSGRNRAVTVA
ncbi:chlorhexidine efflux transporter [Roseovarius sp. THAF9]|uniref:chlorhexidine efflux transporter n=1 Tax=Roseovarius sp. THAF9 TaxID=2587847 RepID=UPI0020C777A0|nr:chlorhexidine efflux transporter [Roseovarius sp. THAF9]